MAFSSDFDTVKQRLLRVNEMLSIIRSGKDLPINHIHDVTPKLNQLKAEGSYIDSASLFKIRNSLETISRLRDFFTATGESTDKYIYPSLAEAFMPMERFPEVVRQIDDAVNRHGEIKDSASPQLAEIRRSMFAVNNSMSGIMRRVIERGVGEGYIDKETTPSIRDGRLVVPVPAMMKRRLSGIVHDESATGKTVFIEPAEVVEANNRLRELKNEEHREIVRILVAIAAAIRPFIPQMLNSYSLLGLFDFIRAKALIANQFDGQMPILERNPDIDFYNAVHPILKLSLEAQGREVVPLNIRLNAENRILVISGPNAGGKSVTLKTVGIVQYMLQCGYLPTAYSNSHFSVFKNLLIDIGDEQSIENDLSTYSSHLKNMKVFLGAASKSTLILIDEMGSGTEPQIGGALAQSILDELNRRKVMGIVTTHYQNLKTFAESTPGLINGAMLYNRQKMQPLFQLSIGSPGSSFALDIAHTVGLPLSIINEAKAIVGTDYVDVDKFMQDIARDRRYWGNKRLSVKEKENKLDSLLTLYEDKLSELRTRKAEILKEARKEAKEILDNSNSALENTILEIRKSQAEKERTKELRRQLNDYKQKVADQASDSEIAGIAPIKHKSRRAAKQKSSPADSAAAAATPLGPGDYVKMKQGNSVGKIISVDAKKAEVAFGALRTIVALDKLQKTSAPKPGIASETQSIAASTSAASRNRQLNFSQEIDVRGMRVDEALQAVTYFIDDAVQFSASQVRILHGTGTGALRQAIRQMLQALNTVESFRDEDVRFGGAGITVVTLN